MPQGQHDLRFREDRTARQGVTRARYEPQRHKGRHKSVLVVAGCLGLTLGLGLGPMVGAFRDAVQTFDPNEPGALLATAATRLREFQYRVRDLRVSDLIDTVTTAYWKQTPKG